MSSLTVCQLNTITLLSRRTVNCIVVTLNRSLTISWNGIVTVESTKKLCDVTLGQGRLFVIARFCLPFLLVDVHELLESDHSPVVAVEVRYKSTQLELLQM